MGEEEKLDVKTGEEVEETAASLLLVSLVDKDIKNFCDKTVLNNVHIANFKLFVFILSNNVSYRTILVTSIFAG